MPPGLHIMILIIYGWTGYYYFSKYLLSLTKQQSLHQFILPSKLVILSPANYSLMHFFNFLMQTAFAYYIIGPDTGQYFAQDTSVFQA